MEFHLFGVICEFLILHEITYALLSYLWWLLYPLRAYDRLCVEDSLWRACQSGCDVQDATRAIDTLGSEKRSRERNGVSQPVTLKIVVIVDLVWIYVDLPRKFFVPERVRVHYVAGNKRFAIGVMKYAHRYMKRMRKQTIGVPKRVPLDAFIVEVEPPKS